MTYSNANFTPGLKGYTDIKPFRFWCQKVLPLVYDDSLSYYELLCKVTDYINNIITDLATTEENVGSLLDAYNQLQDYVNNYFTNLDVQEEINNHLDDLVEDGTLTRLIGNYVQPYLDDFQEQMDTYEENLTQDIGNYKSEMNGNFASLQNSTNANLQQQNDKISVLEGRMDTFSQLTPGSTTGDAELQDIRVAYNGIVYPTAGDAVRGQYENLSDNIINLSEKNYIKLYPQYEIGTLDSGVDATLNSAIRTVNRITSNYDIVIKADAGFRYSIAYYEADGTFISQTSFITIDTNVPKNTSFRLVIRKQPDQYLPADSNLNIFFDHVHIFEYSSTVSVLNDLKLNSLFNYEAVNYETVNGIVNYLGTVYDGSEYYKRLIANVNEGDVIYIEGYNAVSSSFPLYLLMNNDTIVSYYRETVSQNSYLNHTLFIPSGINKIVVNESTNLGTGIVKKAMKNIDFYPDVDEVNYWKNKKIVWFGTSIPAGVVNAGESGGNGSYPVRLGNKLGATIYNESVGSSRARGGNYLVSSENDPLGWGGMSPIGILLSLSISSQEKQDFIDQWDTKWKNIVSDPSGTMDNLTPQLIQTYKNSSWDIKLNKYLSGGEIGQCDLYVFDHGFNESVLPGMFDNMGVEPPTSDPENRAYFMGAMRFLFNKILNDNYKAKIVIIGHYMNAPTQGTTGNYLIKNGVDKCCEAQEKLANTWGIPIIKTWNYMGISNNIITKNNTDMPVLFAIFPDGIHPASDSSGYALQRYAEILYPLFNNLR